MAKKMLMTRARFDKIVTKARKSKKSLPERQAMIDEAFKEMSKDWYK